MPFTPRIQSYKEFSKERLKDVNLFLCMRERNPKIKACVTQTRHVDGCTRFFFELSSGIFVDQSVGFKKVYHLT